MELNKYIDHTNLKPDATKHQIQKLCDQAKKYDFASVCVNPYWVKFCDQQLKNTSVKICTVIGFPLGATSTFSKVQETIEAIQDGADELDMVLNIGELKSGNYQKVKDDIKAVVQAVHQKGKILKVIIEACLLDDNQKIKACELCDELRVDFVKTSTGFSSGGATLHDVKLMKQSVKNHVQIKAAGGIHTKEEALAMIDAGADRIGSSSGVNIMND